MGCYGYAFEKVTAMYQKDTDIFGDQKGDVRQLGYTISDGGGGYFRVTNCHANNIRHFFDTGTADAWQQKKDGNGNVIAEGGEISGVSEYGIVSNIVSHGASSLAMSTHENTYQVTFDNIITNANYGGGTTIRGDRVIFRNSYIEATNNGIYLMNFGKDSGTPTTCEGNHIFENLEVRVPSGEFVINIVSDTTLNAIFKNCTFYGSIAFNAPNSHYEFYNCQFFNSDSGAEDALHMEASNITADFFDCDINIRLTPRLVGELNFTNCHIKNSYNLFNGSWSYHVINFKHCIIEALNDIMYMNFLDDNQCNVLLEDCILKKVYFDIDLSGSDSIVNGAHKRFKFVNVTIYPNDVQTVFMTARCSLDIFMKNVTVMCESYISRYNTYLIGIYSSKRGFPVNKKKLRIEVDGVSFVKDYMLYNSLWRGGVVKAETDAEYVKGYICDVTSTEMFTNNVYYIEGASKLTANSLLYDKKQSNVKYTDE